MILETFGCVTICKLVTEKEDYQICEILNHIQQKKISRKLGTRVEESAYGMLILD